MSHQVLEFQALAMERVWGGRRLEELYGRALPAGAPIGELWEIVDRPEAQSVEASSGLTLHELWIGRRTEIFGAKQASHPAGRFPILIKLLDASDVLSVQVHPPAHVAPQLGGEPKTEVWYFAHCEPGACIYAGLRRGATREAFEKKLADGTVADLLHRIPVQRGHSIFIPSGRLHAIGAGCVIMEIQQNSDTTYRVFDWNRTGLDGKPRALHIAESLASADFTDYEPQAVQADQGVIADCPDFRVTKRKVSGGTTIGDPEDFAIVGVAEGRIQCAGREFEAGRFFLVPAKLAPAELHGEGIVLEVRLPAPEN
ncbi:MAG: class I mannose-6-phosphate isomerase [Terrimicrobiaceae bacterium]|nr:class I mannose-6-phosphate isomerase [Terrimicrobiaceae bacterium]